MRRSDDLTTAPEKSSATMGPSDVGSKPPDEEPGVKLLLPEYDRGDQGREVPGFNHEGYAEAEIFYPLPESIHGASDEH